MRSFIFYLAFLLACGSYVLAAPTPKKFTAKQSNEQAQVVKASGGRRRPNANVGSKTDSTTEVDADLLPDIESLCSRSIESRSIVAPPSLKDHPSRGGVHKADIIAEIIEKVQAYQADSSGQKLKRDMLDDVVEALSELSRLEAASPDDINPPSKDIIQNPPAEKPEPIIGFKQSAAIKNKDAQSQSVKNALRIKGDLKNKVNRKQKQKQHQTIEIEAK
ncbi:hypothetical protein TWF730_010665 [Orbilia blumenaviensis]|uniref:Secreted protein n=1 Tax=Orbilia blumenaviensis TaxID=1796055 RepID=A0AAV9UPQ4_9PEZI